MSLFKLLKEDLDPGLIAVNCGSLLQYGFCPSFVPPLMCSFGLLKHFLGIFESLSPVDPITTSRSDLLCQSLWKIDVIVSGPVHENHRQDRVEELFPRHRALG